MTQLFLSYSRQEVTFVDSLSRELDKRGLQTFVDFRDLLPGHPWHEQLDDNIRRCEALLLVVSKASLSSEPVRKEWSLALKENKRVILVIFEAVRLPSELTSCEWVDFRLDFNKAIQQLEALLAAQQQIPPASAPQPGSLRPPALRLAFWLSVAISVVTGLVFLALLYIVTQSLLQILSTGMLSPRVGQPAGLLIVGWVYFIVSFGWVAKTLVPLPLQIHRRTYERRPTLTTLFIVFLLCFIPLGMDDTLIETLVTITRICLAAVSAVLFGLILRSPDIYRWAGPTDNRLIERSRVPVWNLRGCSTSIALLVGIPIIALIIPLALNIGSDLSICLLLIYLVAVPFLVVYRSRILAWLKRKLIARGLWASVPIQKPARAVKVVMEYAYDDGEVAGELYGHLIAAGHQIVSSTKDQPESALVLLSRFKTSTNIDMETDSVAVIPIIIETCAVSPKLAQRQWLDLRLGVYGKLEQIALLLPEPKKLLDELGIFPTRLKFVRPITVSALITLLRFYLIFQVFSVAVGLFLDPTGVAVPLKVQQAIDALASQYSRNGQVTLSVLVGQSNVVVWAEVSGQEENERPSYCFILDHTSPDDGLFLGAWIATQTGNSWSFRAFETTQALFEATDNPFCVQGGIFESDRQLLVRGAIAVLTLIAAQRIANRSGNRGVLYTILGAIVVLLFVGPLTNLIDLIAVIVVVAVVILGNREIKYWIPPT